mgnify:CR=1 FL=1
MMSQYVKRSVDEFEQLMRRCPQLVTSKNLKERISTAMEKEHCVNYNAVQEEPKKAKAYIKVYVK